MKAILHYHQHQSKKGKNSLRYKPNFRGSTWKIRVVKAKKSSIIESATTRQLSQTGARTIPLWSPLNLLHLTAKVLKIITYPYVIALLINGKEWVRIARLLRLSILEGSRLKQASDLSLCRWTSISAERAKIGNRTCHHLREVISCLTSPKKDTWCLHPIWQLNSRCNHWSKRVWACLLSPP